MEEHRWEGSADKLFEHLWLLADKGLMDQSRMNTLIDRKLCKDPIAVDGLGMGPNV
jgi:hypothetical protein